MTQHDPVVDERVSNGTCSAWVADLPGVYAAADTAAGAKRAIRSAVANPYRDSSAAYTLRGLLLERGVGPVRVFVNLETLTEVRHSRWDPILRPERAIDGRWTVDAWAPLDGRVITGGVRVQL